MTHPYALHLIATIWSIRDALAAVPGVIRDEAVTRAPVGPRGQGGRRGPRSITRLSALIHQRERATRAAHDRAIQEAERITNARVGITRIGCTPAPVRPELLDLAQHGGATIALALEDAAWTVASARRADPLRLRDGRLVAVSASDPNAYLRAALPGSPPETAMEVLGELERIASGMWETLHLESPSTPLPGNPPCPGCDQRMLRLRCVGPRSAWTVVCGANCVCQGPDVCWCDCEPQIIGMRHIWPLSAVYGRQEAA